MKKSKPIVAVLPLVFLFIFSSFQFTLSDPLDDYINSMGSNTDAKLIVEIHQPGANFGDDQKLIWSPNNITEHREMQISILAVNFNQLNQVNTFNLKWIFHNGNIDTTYSEFIITDYTRNSTNNGMIVTTLFTYDKETWSGNYTLVVQLNLTDGSSLSGSSEEIVFKEHDFFLIMNGNTGDNFVCTCSQTNFNLTILNSGSSETSFSLTIAYSYVEYKEFSIEIQEAGSGDDEITEETIPLSGGESHSVIIKFVPTNGISPNRHYTIRPLDVNINYEADGDENVELFDGILSFRLFSLPEYSHPEAMVKIIDYNYENMFNTNSSNIGENETVYTLGAEYLFLEYDVQSLGYTNAKISLNSSTNLGNIKILYDGLNLTLTEFNDMRNTIQQKGKITFQIFVEIDPEIENTLFELDIKFAAAYVTNTAFRLSYSPLVGNEIISSESNNIVFESIDEVRVIPLKIDTSFLDNLTYFENKWSLSCSNVDGFMIAIIGLQFPCNEDKTSLPDNVNSTYDIEISLENWRPTQIIDIQISLYHDPSLTQSNLAQSVNISLNLEIKEGHDSGDNETGDNNTIIDEDDRDLDADNDGILDSQDNCLNTKLDAMVDSFGCEIVVQDTNGDTENSDFIAVKSDDNDFLSYAIFSAIAIIAIVMLQFYRLKKSKPEQLTPITVNEDTPIPLNNTPYQVLKPVVLQQWTDANGYSWRQMSDEKIMWWNGTDWIPYGKN